jgi:copper homeostasis protein CutC
MNPNTMKLRSDIEFHDDIRLLVYRPHGVIDEEAVKKIVSVLEDLEAKLQRPFDRFSDTLQADEVELNFKYVIQVSLCRRLSYAGHPSVKSAILARDSTMIHYARLHALLTQGSPIHVRVFQNRKEAAEWLGVPIERLSAETKDSS